jgi:hypothetical protein
MLHFHRHTVQNLKSRDSNSAKKRQPRTRQTHTTTTTGTPGRDGGEQRGSLGFGVRLDAHRAHRLVARGLRQDEELLEALLLGLYQHDDLGGSRPRGGDLRGA